MNLLVIAWLVCVAHLAHAVDFQICHSLRAPVEVLVQGCPNVPCPLYRQEYARANITFVVPRDTRQLKLRVKSRTLPLGPTIVFPLKDTDVCNGLAGASCPLVRDQVVTYHLEMPVLKIYPKLSLELSLYFIDDYGKTTACFQLPCRVKDRKQKKRILEYF